jgi:hypothetical protein
MRYSGFTTEIDWEELGSFISMLGLCAFLLIIVGVMAAVNPQPSYGYSSYNYSSRNSGPDACDVLLCFALLKACDNKGGGGHRSTTWG